MVSSEHHQTEPLQLDNTAYWYLEHKNTDAKKTATSAEGPQPGRVLILNFRVLTDTKIEYLHYSAAPSHCRKIQLSLVLCKHGRRNNPLPEGNQLK